MADDWLSITEAAKLVDYHPDTIRDLAKAGRLRARKIVTVWQVSRASVLAYIRTAEDNGQKRGRKKVIDTK